MIIEVNRINTFYGDSHILHDVSLVVNQKEIVCLLGRNGAGKTTTLRSIMGLTPPRSGSIKFKGIEISRKKPYEIAKLGIGFVPDDRRIFPNLTVRENLEIAKRKGKKGQVWTVERVYDLFPTLSALDSRLGMYLSGGEQKMLAIGRALMVDPELLLLDEPSEGLAPMVVRDLIKAIEKIREEGVAVLLADQNLRFARKIAERGYIIERGVIRYEGSMKEIWENEELVRKYLTV